MAVVAKHLLPNTLDSLRDLLGRGATGRLWRQGPRGGGREVFILQGQIVAAHGPDDGPWVVRRLVNTGALTERQGKAFIRRLTKGVSFEELILGHVPDSLLERLLSARFRQNLLDFLSTPPPIEFEAMDTMFVSNLQPRQDTRRLLASILALKERIGPLMRHRGPLTLRLGPSMPGSRDLARIVDLCEPPIPLRDLLTFSPFETGETLDHVITLLQTGALVTDEGVRLSGGPNRQADEAFAVEDLFSLDNDDTPRSVGNPALPISPEHLALLNEYAEASIDGDFGESPAAFVGATEDEPVEEPAEELPRLETAFFSDVDEAPKPARPNVALFVAGGTDVDQPAQDNADEESAGWIPDEDEGDFADPNAPIAGASLPGSMQPPPVEIMFEANDEPDSSALFVSGSLSALVADGHGPDGSADHDGFAAFAHANLDEDDPSDVGFDIDDDASLMPALDAPSSQAEAYDPFAVDSGAVAPGEDDPFGAPSSSEPSDAPGADDPFAVDDAAPYEAAWPSVDDEPATPAVDEESEWPDFDDEEGSIYEAVEPVPRPAPSPAANEDAPAAEGTETGSNPLLDAARRYLEEATQRRERKPRTSTPVDEEGDAPAESSDEVVHRERKFTGFEFSVEDGEMAMFEDHDRIRGGGMGQFTLDRKLLDKVEIGAPDPSTRASPYQGLPEEESIIEMGEASAEEEANAGTVALAFSAPKLQISRVQQKIAVGREVGEVVARYLNQYVGPGVGQTTIQLLVDSAATTRARLFHEVTVNEAGQFDEERVLANLRRRPDSEQRILLDQGIQDFIERALSTADSELPEEVLYSLLEEIAGYQQRLRL